MKLLLNLRACPKINGLFALLMIIAEACATTSGPTFEKARVIERMGDADETPDWTTGSIAMTSQGSDIIFNHFLTMTGNSRVDACLKVVDIEARTAFLRHINENISTSGQLNEVNAQDDPSYESLTTFLSQGKISGAKTLERYWERMEESNEAGERVLRLRCATKLAIKKADLERQLRSALGNGGNQEIREKLIQAQKEFIETAGK